MNKDYVEPEEKNEDDDEDDVDLADREKLDTQINLGSEGDDNELMSLNENSPKKK